MFVHTLYYVFAVCVLIQRSVGYDFEDAADRVLLQTEHNPQLNNKTAAVPALIQDDKVCDKAVQLQKILGLMISMLRQDLTENSKTALVLQTLKDMLRNTAAYNDEVINKIDDLIRTLDKYKEPGEKIKALRSDVDNTHNQILVKRSPKLNPTIRIKYELPILKNSYCTEVLLNIINIAYRAYANLAKNPICNLPSLPYLSPGVGKPEMNPYLPDFYKPVMPNPNLQPGPKRLTSFLDLPFGDDPMNSNNLNPNNNIQNPYPEQLPLNYIPLYSYKPQGSNPKSPLALPLQKKPYFPFDVKPLSQPLNRYYPNGNNILYTPKVPMLFPKEKKPVYSYGMTPRPNPKDTQKADFESPTSNPNYTDAPTDTNLAVINSIDPNNPYSKYNFPQSLPGQPESESLKYIPLFNYKLNGNNFLPAEPDVSELLYKPYTSSLNNLHPHYTPVNPLIKNLSDHISPVPLIDHGIQEAKDKYSYKPDASKPNNLPPYFFPANPHVINHNSPYSPVQTTDIGSPGSESYGFPYKPITSKPNNMLPYFFPVNPHVKNPSISYSPVQASDGDSSGSEAYGFPYKLVTSKPNNLLPYHFPVNPFVKDPSSHNAPVPLTDGSSPGNEIYELPYKPDTLKPNNLRPHFFPVNPHVKNPNSPYSLVQATDSGSSGSEAYEFPYKPVTSKPNNLLPYHFTVNPFVKGPSSHNAPVPWYDGGSPGNEIYELPYKPDTPNNLRPYFFPVNPHVKNPNSPYSLVQATDSGSSGSEAYGFPYKPVTSKPNNLLPYHFPFNPFVEDPNSHTAPVPLTDGGSPGNEIYELPYKPDTLKPANLRPYFFPVKTSAKDPNNPTAAPTLVAKDELNLNHNELGPDAFVPPGYSYIPIIQNPVYESNLNTKPSENPLYPKTVTLPPPSKTLQAQDLKIIGFIKEAIAIIEGAIPVVKFDPPTLYIIAEIKNILAKDIGVDDYFTILELYKKLIDYVKQLSVYKQIIDLIDLPSMTNPSKLQPKKVVELTYLVKRPQPVIYYPYYYIKYRLPYPSFMVAAKNLLRVKPHLRTTPNKMYDELLAQSKLSETSPALKKYEEKDILGLTFKSGSLVGAKLIGENGTLTEQLNILKHISSDKTEGDIFKFDEVTDFETAKKTYNELNEINHLAKKNELLNEPANIEKSKDKKKQQTSSLTVSSSLLRSENRANIYQNDLSHHNSTEANLDFTSFESKKLRGDVLRGEFVGLPFSNYVIPTNVIPLNGPNETNAKIDQASVANKLYDATLQASSILRENNQENLINSGGIMNLDNENISLNTGTDNQQEFVNISNPKVIVNSAASFHSLKNTEKTKTNEGNFKLHNWINTAVQQVNHHNSGNMWANQQNYYNSGGLLNFDNQKILLNTGTGNRQHNVNFMNPKILYNKVADSRTSQAPIDQHSFNDGTNTNTDPTDRTATKQISDNSSLSPIEASNGATSPDDLPKFDSAGKGISNGEIIVGRTQNVIEQTTTRQKPNPNQPSIYTVAPNQREMADFIKNTVKDDSHQFANADSTKPLLSANERDKPDSGNFENYDSMKPHNSHNSIPPDSNTILPTGMTKSPHNTMTINPEAANQGATNVYSKETKIRVTNNPKNTVSPNNNQLFLPADIEYHEGNFGYTGMAGQQNYGGVSQQNIREYESGTTGQAAGANQQNFATYGTGAGIPGFQINSYVVPRKQVFYSRPMVQSFPIGSGYLARGLLLG